ncbi:putative membrane protein [Rivularia sp. PCC 7116]|uniref:DUF2254 domain-containing protein n=1 Tax=Rivularia sp. PCC 7116 TaxID=373994 RepID=UPI00029F06A4|nr:DUF2254 domain-containing protein [Rivularia sp. PCC 7116]AFY56526.1 putative membrane protein [Rivularia sp. PCC 7116]
MKNIRLGKLWDSLNSSYWFVPTVMTTISTLLAFFLLRLDRLSFYGPLEKWGWIYTGSADGARGVLSTVAGSTIGITATAFSITIVALQLASSNFGPRILRNFMQDIGNKIVLGSFISTFVYSLLVLRAIYGSAEDRNQFVPHLSVTVGIVLAIFCTGVLIYFIHHASTIIQVSYVISQISQELDSTIEKLYPQKIGYSEPEHKHSQKLIPDNFDREAFPVRASKKGYVQAVDTDKLMDIACKHNLMVKILTHPGKFVIQGGYLVKILSMASDNYKTPDFKDIQKQIQQAFILGRERNEQQDVEFPINQLVEIALRALSPSLNDPFTAIRCIDHLSAGLSRLAQTNFPSPYRYDGFDNLRVIAYPVTFAGLTDAAFNQIRQNCCGDVAVTVRLLESIAVIAEYTENSQHKKALRRHADLILKGSRQELAFEEDKQDVEQRYAAVLKANGE